jgi:hypothetical protein
VAIKQALHLVSGEVVRLGEPWPGAGADKPKVSWIVSRGVTFETDDEDNISEQRPAEFEVWFLPPEFDLIATHYRAVADYWQSGRGIPPKHQDLLDEILNKIPGAMCRRVNARYVLCCDEVHDMRSAWESSLKFEVEAQFEAIDFDGDDEDEKPVAQVTQFDAPQSDLRPTSNGPGAHAG